MKALPWIPLFVVTALPCLAEKAAFELRRPAGQLVVTARLENVKEEEILSALEQGLESEIVYHFRLFERTTGIFSFLGDRLLSQEAIGFTASLDRFNNTYVIDPTQGEPRLFKEKNDFLCRFLELEAHAFSEFQPEPDKQYYLRARIQLTPAVISGPLSIILLFFRTGITTEWIELAVEPGVSR